MHKSSICWLNRMLIPFEDEQRRLLVNLNSGYETWLMTSRQLRALPYNLTWKRISGRDYLYRLTDRQGSGTSVGPRSPETEAAYNSYRAEKEIGRATGRGRGGRYG